MRVGIMLQQQYKQILVPVDGSYEAELAFKKKVSQLQSVIMHLFT